mgnify:CR=1 FL=1
MFLFLVFIPDFHDMQNIAALKSTAHQILVNFLLFFAVNPVYAVCAGAYAGRNIKSAWWLPIITSGLFLAGTWIFFDWGEPAFWQYALAYLLLGIAAMLISMCIKRH